VQAKFNIPIFGYFLTGRKCKYCSISISAKYPIIELSTSILFLLIVIFSRNVTELLLWSIFLITAFPLALIDIKEKRLPNRLTGSLFFSLLLITVVDYFLKKDLSALLKTLSCSASLLIIYLLIHVVSGGGIGMGDVKLAPSLGLITGYFGIASTYISSLIGFFLGSMVGLFMMLIGKATRKSALPFGPFMILGAALGPAATTVILKFLGFN
jgi:leader peptidase (prepilin peptidase)/N-methyltransferase